MGQRWKGSTPSKLGLHKVRQTLKTTTDNRTYNVTLRYHEAVDCIVCMGLCGYGPRKANQFKRSRGQKPRYKDKRKTWGRIKD